MCFSAKASLLASVGLLFIGILSLKNVKKPNQAFFAAIPLLFSLQQFSEYLLWIFLPDMRYPQLIDLAKYSFITFAFIIWPIWIPLSLYNFEPIAKNKKWLFSNLILGTIWSIAIGVVLLGYTTNVEISCSHIAYYLKAPFDQYRDAAISIYCLTTLLPFYLTSDKKIWIFGSLIGISCTISYFVWYSYFTSVWCFFAALISCCVYLFSKKFDQTS